MPKKPRKNKNLTTQSVDDDENPELTEEDFKNSKPIYGLLVEKIGKKNADMLMQGKVGRPVAEHTKQPVSIRVDENILKAFKAKGKGWQTEMHHALEYWVEHKL